MSVHTLINIGIVQCSQYVYYIRYCYDNYELVKCYRRHADWQVAKSAHARGLLQWRTLRETAVNLRNHSSTACLPVTAALTSIYKTVPLQLHKYAITSSKATSLPKDSPTFCCFAFIISTVRRVVLCCILTANTASFSPHYSKMGGSYTLFYFVSYCHVSQWLKTGFWLVIWFISHLQDLTTIN
jgi:hypothetical protein